jgi:microcystin-dependent protein
VTNRRQWLTPNTATGAKTCRRLFIPVELIAHVNGALYEMTLPWRWEEHGTMTIEEAVELSKTMLVEYMESNCMIGSIHPYVTDLPAGVLACDGTQYARVDYPVLYDRLNAAYVVDADNFVVPDLRGRVIIGAGSGGGLTARSVGDRGGEETHQLTAGEMPTHNHSTHQHGVDLDVEGPVGVPQPVTGYAFASVTGNAGSDNPHENMPPFEALTWGIVAY